MPTIAPTPTAGIIRATILPCKQSFYSSISIPMRKLFIIVIASCLNIFNSHAQTAPDTSMCSGIKPLFDYLLHSNRLNISAEENITIQSLVTDATNAGYVIAATPVITSNLNGLFYTLTPDYVSFPGIINAPKDSAYKARFGNMTLVFRSANGPFEHQQGSFYSKLCSSANVVEYASSAMPSACEQFAIQHTASDDQLDWYVSYTNCDGVRERIYLHANDQKVEFCGTAVNLVQDVDTMRLIYAAATYTMNSVNSPACSFNANAYYRPTTAFLEVTQGTNKVAQTVGKKLQVKAFPNPASSRFSLSVDGQAQLPVSIRITNLYGKAVETMTVVPGSTLNLGAGYGAGLYYAEVAQGNERATIKLVKL